MSTKEIKKQVSSKKVTSSKSGNHLAPKKTTTINSNSTKHDIDDIFSKTKTKSNNDKNDLDKKQQLPASSTKISKESKLIKRKMEENSEIDDAFSSKTGKSSGNKSAKYTSEGYRIYSMEELGSGKGGETPLCPFDCQCCFI